MKKQGVAIFYALVMILSLGLHSSSTLAQMGAEGMPCVPGMLGGGGLWSVLVVILTLAIIAALIGATIYFVRQSSRPRER